jgi:pyruvate/2-oxoglutarate dehydrogenase complex dihydrolipoamide dehydrogenase (E3) component
MQPSEAPRTYSCCRQQIVASPPSVPGIFAAGDCRSGSTKQAASAAGEGAAALAIHRYVEPRAGGMPQRKTMEQEMATM